MPETSLTRAVQIAETLRVLIAGQTFTADRRILTVTVSIGVATLETSRRDLDELIAAADAALYRAKAQGRNKVCIFSESMA